MKKAKLGERDNDEYYFVWPAGRGKKVRKPLRIQEYQDRYQIKQLSTGDMLREEVASESWGSVAIKGDYGCGRACP